MDDYMDDLYIELHRSLPDLFLKPDTTCKQTFDRRHHTEETMELNTLIQSATVALMAAAWKVAGAAALWLVGRWLIGFALNLVSRAFARQQFDVTLARYLQTGLRIILNVTLIVALLGFFGVETTTFA